MSYARYLQSVIATICDWRRHSGTFRVWYTVFHTTEVTLAVFAEMLFVLGSTRYIRDSCIKPSEVIDIVFSIIAIWRSRCFQYTDTIFTHI
ncbi:hypothetical protein EJ05DRAFT_211360 [Pseudovirgaria hyperparasitica]|uniref:Uncharacterized protein n=1 Tax=Pseudovirgaria hyperparasitica TaxID=470096 RepID=A0A6A6VU58_9PEZI|nr:uncharacterized protein EJ05DRAFT_211360 [Pseudovirgaria hyperparasitica]KAF2753326.1 hypothetical protein EJ05DRAFT_211360 [Pseudovirgaria hyperparasitica]